MTLNETFTDAQLDAARAMILPVASDPRQGEILLCAAALLIAGLAIEGADPLQDAIAMANEVLGNAIEFIALVSETEEGERRFDA